MFGPGSQFRVCVPIGLYHQLDGITNPKYKLFHFLTNITFFYKKKKALALNQERCCHLVLCLWQILVHSKIVVMRCVSLIRQYRISLKILDKTLPFCLAVCSEGKRFMILAPGLYQDDFLSPWVPLDLVVLWWSGLSLPYTLGLLNLWLTLQ